MFRLIALPSGEWLVLSQSHRIVSIVAEAVIKKTSAVFYGADPHTVKKAHTARESMMVAQIDGSGEWYSSSVSI